MEIRLIDKYRGATFTPRGPVTDPYAALEELRRCTVDQHKQAYFCADGEFIAALKKVDPDLKNLAHGERVEGPTFKGIPVVELVPSNGANVAGGHVSTTPGTVAGQDKGKLVPKHELLPV